jgi:hypothetical protein
VIRQKTLNSNETYDDELDRRHNLLLIEINIQKAVAQVELTEKELQMLAAIKSQDPSSTKTNPIKPAKSLRCILYFLVEAALS